MPYVTFSISIQCWKPGNFDIDRCGHRSNWCSHCSAWIDQGRQYLRMSRRCTCHTFSKVWIWWSRKMCFLLFWVSLIQCLVPPIRVGERGFELNATDSMISTMLFLLFSYNFICLFISLASKSDRLAKPSVLCKLQHSIHSDLSDIEAPWKMNRRNLKLQILRIRTKSPANGTLWGGRGFIGIFLIFSRILIWTDKFYPVCIGGFSQKQPLCSRNIPCRRTGFATQWWTMLLGRSHVLRAARSDGSLCSRIFQHHVFIKTLFSFLSIFLFSLFSSFSSVFRAEGLKHNKKYSENVQKL